MGIPASTPYLYRFASTPGKVYGPRPFVYVVSRYASQHDCTCAPAGLDNTPTGPWQPVAEVAPQLIPEPPEAATERQRKRLTKLGISHSAELSADAARQLIQAAEQHLLPTAGQRRKLAAAKIALPAGATRAVVEGLLDEHERSVSIRALRRAGAVLPDDATWDEISEVEQALDDADEAKRMLAPLRRKGLTIPDAVTLDDAYEWESAWNDAQDGLAEARREIGLRAAIPPVTTPGELEAFGSALYDTVQAAGLWETTLDWLRERRDGIPRMPTKAQRRAVMPILFERVRSGTWQGSDADDRWLTDQALAVVPTRRAETSRPKDPTPPTRPIATRRKPPSLWRQLFGGSA